MLVQAAVPLTMHMHPHRICCLLRHVADDHTNAQAWFLPALLLQLKPVPCFLALLLIAESILVLAVWRRCAAAAWRKPSSEPQG